jgi:uncharacterized protein YdcH (DUF465 family)
MKTMASSNEESLNSAAHILQQYPAYRERILDLLATDPQFAEMNEEYEQVRRTLDELSSEAGETMSTAAEFRRLRTDLETDFTDVLATGDQPGN